MTIGPKMDGGPNTKYFESAETLNALEGVKNWLQKNAKKVSTQSAILITFILIEGVGICASTYCILDYVKQFL